MQNMVGFRWKNGLRTSTKPLKLNLFKLFCKKLPWILLLRVREYEKMIVYVIFFRIHHIKVYFWSLKNPFWIFKALILMTNLEKWKLCFVKPKNELKTKKMRAETGYMLVPDFLSYDQKMKGKRPIYWKIVFQYFVTYLFW